MTTKKAPDNRIHLYDCEFKLLAISRELRKRGYTVLAEQLREAAARIAEAAGD